MKMQKECAWHKINFGVELIMEEGDPERVTHGMCKECEEIENRKIDEFLKGENK